MRDEFAGVSYDSVEFVTVVLMFWQVHKKPIVPGHSAPRRIQSVGLHRCFRCEPPHRLPNHPSKQRALPYANRHGHRTITMNYYVSGICYTGTTAWLLCSLFLPHPHLIYCCIVIHILFTFIIYYFFPLRYCLLLLL